MNKVLRKFKAFNFAKSKKNRIFANDDEPSALATDVGKPCIVSGKDAERFLERMREVELEAERRSKMPPTLEELKSRLFYEELVFNMEKDRLALKKEEIRKLKEKIKDLEKKNGKTEEE